MAPAHIRARREDGDSSRLQDVVGAGIRRGEKGGTRLQREWDRGPERGPRGRANLRDVREGDEKRPKRRHDERVAEGAVLERGAGGVGIRRARAGEKEADQDARGRAREGDQRQSEQCARGVGGRDEGPHLWRRERALHERLVRRNAPVDAARVVGVRVDEVACGVDGDGAAGGEAEAEGREDVVELEGERGAEQHRRH